MLKVVPIPILNDNYIWTIIHDKKTVVVDPGLSDPVLNYHQRNNLELTAILITHHHHDHIGGVDGIINQFNVPVYAPYHEKFNFTYHQVQENRASQCARAPWDPPQALPCRGCPRGPPGPGDR